MTDEAVNFLKEFVTKPQQIGAIVPSSPALAREIVARIEWAKAEIVVEYGPGLGAVTSEILRRAEGCDFFAIEVNEVYAEAFVQRFPGVPLYRDSAANVVDICARHGVDHVDAVVSGLPWANFSHETQDEVLDAMLDVLAPEGQFATFAYMHGLALPSGRRFRHKLEAHFRTVERSSVVWRNTPPAVVYHCRR